MFSRETQALMEAAVDAIIVIDARGVISAANDATLHMFGYETGEMLGENVRMLMPEPDRGAHDEYMRQYLRTGKARIIGIGRVVTARRKDGTLFPAHLSVGRVRDSDPAQFVGIVRDVTPEHEALAALKLERDRAHLTHERITRVARFATMGEMAAGVAHELNQPLTAIATYASACERYLGATRPDLAEIREAVREIVAESMRAGEIIRRLRQLVRGDHQAHMPTDLNALVEELRTLLLADARIHDTRLQIGMSHDLPRVSANSIQIQQVILNLVKNALEALTDSPAESREVNLTTARTKDGGVELRVADNGPGISPGIADRLFEPFSTTKKSGTGLGLAISRTIVQSHGGTIGVRPGQPRGAVFFARLPAVEENA